MSIEKALADHTAALNNLAEAMKRHATVMEVGQLPGFVQERKAKEAVEAKAKEEKTVEPETTADDEVEEKPAKKATKKKAPAKKAEPKKEEAEDSDGLSDEERDVLENTIRPLCRKVGAAKGRDTVLGMFSEFGRNVKSIVDLEPSQYDDFIERLESELAEDDDTDEDDF